MRQSEGVSACTVCVACGVVAASAPRVSVCLRERCVFADGDSVECVTITIFVLCVFMQVDYLSRLVLEFFLERSLRECEVWEWPGDVQFLEIYIFFEIPSRKKILHVCL